MCGREAAGRSGNAAFKLVCEGFHSPCGNAGPVKENSEFSNAPQNPSCRGKADRLFVFVSREKDVFKAGALNCVSQFLAAIASQIGRVNKGHGGVNLVRVGRYCFTKSGLS